MIVHECEQRTDEWHQLRIGLATASRFKEILTPAKLEYSKQAYKYALTCATEQIIGEPCDLDRTQWMDRGTELEPEARAAYEFDMDCVVKPCGFITTDDGLTGCSADGLVGDDGGIEIKCPSARVHFGYMLGDSPPHVAQVQGCLFVTGRKWWDWVSYCPGQPLHRIRFERDDAFCDALGGALARFHEEVADIRGRLESMGVRRRAERCKVIVEREQGRNWCMKSTVAEVDGMWVCAEHAGK